MAQKRDIHIEYPEAWELIVAVRDSQVDYILYAPSVPNSLIIGNVPLDEASLQGLEDAVYDTPELLGEYKRVRVVVHSTHYVLLPVDADGMPIHVGDMMEDDGEPFTICAVAPGCVHRWHVCNIGEPSKGTVSYPPISLRHYVPDSIERVALDMRDSISEHVGLAPDEVLAFVERLKRLERAE